MTKHFRHARWTLAALLSALVIFASRPAGAHPMPSSAVLLDFHDASVAIELRLPLSELEIGFGKPLTRDPQNSVARLRGDLAAYIARHVSAQTPDGRPWRTTVRDVALGPRETIQDLVAHVRLEPPSGAPVRRFTMHYDVIVHQLVTHVALVSVRRDWNNAVLSGSPVFLGEVRWHSKTFTVNLPAGSAWRGFESVVRLGMRHIAEGTDHLLFLLVLLLPASLIARDGRWGAAAGVRESVLRLLKIVSAFTLGHSLTLIAGAVGWLRAPGQPVEVLIAISIFVSAIHALRPIFPGREALIAAGFGLVHGLAFAGVVAELGLDAWHTTLSIFGFNVGIELMQLLVVGVTAPWLLLLARTPAYPPVRVLGAAAAALAALGWIAERGLVWRNPIGIWVERVAANGIWIVAGLAVLSVAATVWQQRQRVRAAAVRMRRTTAPTRS